MKKSHDRWYHRQIENAYAVAAGLGEKSILVDTRLSVRFKAFTFTNSRNEIRYFGFHCDAFRVRLNVCRELSSLVGKDLQCHIGLVCIDIVKNRILHGQSRNCNIICHKARFVRFTIEVCAHDDDVFFTKPLIPVSHKYKFVSYMDQLRCPYIVTCCIDTGIKLIRFRP